jgi:hypothetical protein
LTKRTHLSLEKKELGIFNVLTTNSFCVQKTPNEPPKQGKIPPFAQHLTGIRELAERQKGLDELRI